MVRAILFDTYGVILNETEVFQNFFNYLKKYLKESGRKITHGQFDNSVKQVILSYVPSLTNALFWHFMKPDIKKCTELTKEFFKYQRRWIDEIQDATIDSVSNLLTAVSKITKD